MRIFVLCLIEVPLSPGKHSFAAQLNNNSNKNKDKLAAFYRTR
jgi:hypothetical protein